MTQTNVDAGLVENFAAVTATSTVGAATAEVETDVEIKRKSSLIIGKPRDGLVGLLIKERSVVLLMVLFLCLYLKLIARQG